MRIHSAGYPDAKICHYKKENSRDQACAKNIKNRQLVFQPHPEISDDYERPPCVKNHVVHAHNEVAHNHYSKRHPWHYLFIENRPREDRDSGDRRDIRHMRDKPHQKTKDYQDICDHFSLLL